jgi:hypothetical protein
MTGYVLVGGSRGWFVSRSGNPSSYTPRLQDAEVFPTVEAAARSKCGNESIRTVDSIFGAVR